jgi:hypothetical protein
LLSAELADARAACSLPGDRDDQPNRSAYRAQKDSYGVSRLEPDFLPLLALKKSEQPLICQFDRQAYSAGATCVRARGAFLNQPRMPRGMKITNRISRMP